MSVYIKGMEMPTMPENIGQGENIPYIDVRIFADGSAVTSKNERPYYTQFAAVPVPDHGDLIDRDETMNAILEERGEDYSAWYAEIVNEMPTILAADKEVDDG